MAKGKFIDVTLRLIDKMTSPLEGVGASLAKSNRQWQKAGREITKVGNNIAKTGESMTKSLTVPILGAGAACVTLAADFEAGMSKVQSICGATEQEMEKLSKKAKEMGAKTKYSASEATEAFSYMAMAGWETQQMLDGIEGVMYLAGATGEDLALTSDIVTDALTAFGMAASDTNEFVDVLAMTANKSNTSVSMLGESFQYVGPVAGALGYSVQDVSTALGLMANSGVKASIAGTALRSWMSRMSAPTDAVQKAMDKLGISLTDSSGEMLSFENVMQQTKKAFNGLTEAEKAQYASVLAGKQGMSGLLAIVNSADSDFDALSQAINNSNGACKQMYDVANDNLQGQLTILKSTIESVGIAFGEKLTPYIKDATQWLQGVAENVNNLSDEEMNLIIKTAGIVAAIGPAIMIFGKMVVGVGKVVTLVGKAGAAIKTAGGVGAAISAGITGPVGIAIAVVAGLVAVGVALYKNWDKVKAGAKSMFKYVKNVFSTLGMSGDSFKEKIAPLGDKFDGIKEKLKEFWITVEPLVSAFGEALAFYFGTHFAYIVGVASGLFTSFFDTISSWLSGVMTAFDGLITFLTGVFTGDWSKAWEGVKTIFSGVFESLVAIVKAPMNAIIGIINGVIAGINNMGLKIPDWVPGIGGKAFSINIPRIPALAKGTNNWQGGLVQISERGGEIVDLPSGSRVYPHDESVRKAYSDGARLNSNVTIAKLADTIIIREEADIDKLADKLADKVEKVSQNLGGEDIGYSY